jgi:hypothetical protein
MTMLGLKLYGAIIITLFVLIVLAVLVLLAIGVYNNKSFITTDVVQLARFPLPVISMQLRNKFKISCEFLLFDFYNDSRKLVQNFYEASLSLS